MDGTTVEINNTDAEGRLTLGDAITYARTKIEPDEMFDFATLTGACMVALGPYTAGVMSDNEALVASAGSRPRSARGEDMWRLPLNSRAARAAQEPDRRHAQHRRPLRRRDHRRPVPQDVRQGHPVGPRRHRRPGLDARATRPSQPKGGTGFAVATIVEYATR